MHVSRSHADGLFPSSQRYCFDKIAKSQQSLFLLCNKSRLRPQSKFMAPLTELESSSAMLTVNTVGSCAELLEMSNVCSLQATQPARLSLDPVAFRRAQCIGTISLAMASSGLRWGCNGGKALRHLHHRHRCQASLQCSVQPTVCYLHEHACAGAVGCISRKFDESESSTSGQGLRKRFESTRPCGHRSVDTDPQLAQLATETQNAQAFSGVTAISHIGDGCRSTVFRAGLN